MNTAKAKKKTKKNGSPKATLPIVLSDEIGNEILEALDENRDYREAEAKAIPAIYQSLGGIVRELAPMGKDGTNEYLNFDARTIEGCVDWLAPKLKKHNLFITQKILRLETKNEVDPRAPNGPASFARVTVHIEYQWHSTIDGSSLKTEGIGAHLSKGDKGVHSADSGAFKYMVSRLSCAPFKQVDSCTESEYEEAVEEAEKKQPKKNKPERALSKPPRFDEVKVPQKMWETKWPDPVGKPNGEVFFRECSPELAGIMLFNFLDRTGIDMKCDHLLLQATVNGHPCLDFPVLQKLRRDGFPVEVVPLLGTDAAEAEMTKKIREFTRELGFGSGIEFTGKA